MSDDRRGLITGSAGRNILSLSRLMMLDPRRGEAGAHRFIKRLNVQGLTWLLTSHLSLSLSSSVSTPSLSQYCFLSESKSQRPHLHDESPGVARATHGCEVKVKASLDDSCESEPSSFDNNVSTRCKSPLLARQGTNMSHKQRQLM